MVEKAYWNPKLSYLVIVTKQAVRRNSRYVVVDKSDLMNEHAFRSALERLVPVLDTPEKSLRELWGDLGYAHSAGDRPPKPAVRRRIKST